MVTIDTYDKSVPYEVFVRDVARAVVSQLAQVRNDPEFVSQRQAYDMFGRGNVDRWRREGRVDPSIRPGKIEYRTADLRRLQQQKQDYFKLG